METTDLNIMTDNRKERLKKRRKEHIRELILLYSKNKSAVFGLIILAIFVFAALFADLIIPYEMGIKQSAADRLLWPCSAHLFGTDKYGRDIFARVVHGSRRSLALGLGTTVLSVTIGGIIGAWCGYIGGKVDSIIMRLCDVLMCIPSLLFALAVVAAFGTSIGNLIFAITIITVPSYIRIIRSVVLSIVEQENI